MPPQLPTMQHQKQGELQTVPNQPPSDRTHAKGGPPMINLGLSAEDAPHTQIYETNPICPTPMSKRTGNPPVADPTDPKMRNEPNLSPANSQSPTAKSCFLRNEPNSPFTRLAESDSPPNIHSTIYNMEHPPVEDTIPRPNSPHRGRHSCKKVHVPGGKIFVFCPIIDRLAARGEGVASFFEKS